MAKGAPAGTRKQVYDVVRQYPGIHVRGLERHTGVSAPLAQYHLHHLAEAGLVESVEQGGYTRWFPSQKEIAIQPSDMPLLGLLREEVPLHLVLLLLDEGPMPHGDLVQRLGMAKSTVSYHLAKLAEAGIIEREPGSTRLRVTHEKRISALLLAHRPTPDLLDAFADLWEDLYGP